MYAYDTVTEAVKGLKDRGYTIDFNLEADCISYPSSKLRPADFEITEVYRFEGNSDPADNSILYVIEANDGLVGYSLDAYGAYSDHDEEGYDEFIRSIPVEERSEQSIFGSEE